MAEPSWLTSPSCLTSALLNCVEMLISLFLSSQSVGRKKQLEQWEMV